MKAFLISGIGADQRMFDFIRFPENVTTEYINWKTPLQNESIEAYAGRLFTGYASHEPFILIGISFGGLIAVEIAKKFKPIRTIIISSIPLNSDLPAIYKIAGKINLHKLLPVTLFKRMTIVKQKMQKQSPENMRLLRQITDDGNELIIKWGMDAVLKWENEILPANLIHIHGEADTVFPISYTSPTHALAGGHMLTLENPLEINLILRQVLSVSELSESFR